jgi:hypothetical protein
VTGPVRTVSRHFDIAALLLGSILLGSPGCGSVTTKKSDGGTGGSPSDSSTKMDVGHDAPKNHDSSSANDMRITDAGAQDAVSHGGSGGAGGKGGAGGSGGGGGGKGGVGGRSGGGGGGGGTIGTGGTGGASVSECNSNGDCMLYPGAGSGCCGVCQPASDPAPPPIECLLACSSLLTVKTCGCVNNQCVGSKTQL